MKITFHGAARTVTGSQYLLAINGHNLLLECGLFQGRRQDSYQRNQSFQYDPGNVDAVILSHAHIDHSGNLPNLVKNGYHSQIFATPATAHLANIMLLDSGHVQESDVEFINRRRARNKEAPIKPLYTLEDAGQVAQYFRPVAYQTPFEPIPGVTAQFVDAGHILGSAAVVLDINEKNKRMRLWFSGDIGRRGLPLIQDPVLPSGVDYLIMESTYGDKQHDDPSRAYEELLRVVKKTIQRGGKVIIPAFAVGRTQEIVYSLHQMIENRELPAIPIFVDSPLAINASEIFRLHPECFDEETREFIRNDKHHAALGFSHLVYTRSVEESKALNFRKEPMVIISASGMAEAGRILHHLKNNIENPRNTILIVSWQAPHTLGRRLADRDEVVTIFGEKYKRQAEIATIGGYSAHAGQNFLLEYALAVKGRARQVILVHGEEKAALTLKEKMGEEGLGEVVYPEWRSVVEV